MSRLWARVAAVAAAGVILAVAQVPAWLCGRHAAGFFRGDLQGDRALGRAAQRWLEQPPESVALSTGSPRFDGEWYLIGHMASALGFAQTAARHPELKDEHLAFTERAIDRLLLPRGRVHDSDAWAEDAVTSLEGEHGHLAFLGYANLALSMNRRLAAQSRFAGLNDEITEALVRRFATREAGLLESYPEETYPADNAVALASIALHDRATQKNDKHAEVVRHALRILSDRCTDARSGLLYQRVDSQTLVARDAARASGTAMAAFVLGYGDREAARPFWEALRGQSKTTLGFGGVEEYVGSGAADVDSGPLIFGYSVSATGLALASARRFHDEARYRASFASVWLFGLPQERRDELTFLAGGSIGDTLLFAFLTAGDET